MPETDTTPPVTAEGSYDWWRTEVAARDADLEHLRHEFEEMTKLHDAKHQDWQRSEGELGRLRNRITALEANGSELLARAERAEYDLEIRTHTARSNARAHRIAYLESEKQRERAEAAEAELALHVGCRADISIGDALRLIRGEESNADAPSPVTAATEAHGETAEAQEGRELLLDPDCRDGKHGSCVGGPCECPHHTHLPIGDPGEPEEGPYCEACGDHWPCREMTEAQKGSR